jgi:predicted Zn-dependent peptidase
LLSLESTSMRMTRLGKGTVTGMPLLRVDEIVRRLDAVTAKDVSALAEELFALGRLSAAGIGPDERRFREAVERVNPRLLSKAA